MDINLTKLSCVISDLDGTLLNSDNQISSEDLETIKKLKASGILVFPATGRHVAFAKDITSRIGFDLPICACNGGHIYSYATGETLFMEQIPTELSVKIYDFLNERRVPYIIYTPDRTIFSEKGERYHYWVRQNESFATVNRFEPGFITEEGFDIRGHKAIKYLIHNKAGLLPEQEFRELFSKNGALSIARSGSELLDVNAQGIDKAKALRFLSERYGFSLSETLALGDNENDMEMLRIAGYSACPENAGEEIKKLAAFTTAPNSSSPLTTAVRHFFPEF